MLKKSETLSLVQIKRMSPKKKNNKMVKIQTISNQILLLNRVLLKEKKLE